MSREALAVRIAAFVDGSLAGRTPEPFEALALAVHRWQVARDPVLAALVEGPVDAWTRIPAVPVALFRELPVGTVRPGRVVFRTSGTSGDGRGEHHLADTALYDRGALAWARRCVPGLPRDACALLEDPGEAPDSSLSHMVALFGRCSWHLRAGVLDRDGLAERTRAGPLFVAATGFALADWLAGPTERLPPGSVLMVTGGFKGRAHAVDEPALLREARAALSPARIVTEYGMTELSSQLWGTPGTAFAPPPWLRAVAVDPEDGAVLRPGVAGQLRFVDLCNLDGTLAIETLDHGVVREDGAVELRGRLPGAPARGCSLTVEEGWR